MNTHLISRTIYLVSSILLLTTSISVKGLEQRCNDNAATSTPTERYIQNSDGSVFDKATRLEWKRCVSGLVGSRCDSGSVRYFTWWEALAEVEVFNMGSSNHSDWRLPNIKELYSIIETACEEPSLNESVFINNPLFPDVSKSWSSTPSNNNTEMAWQIEFQNGLSYTLSNSETLTVRFVRTCDEICQQAYD